MKLRIQGNSLCLRLTRSEVDRLCNEGEVSETVSFRSCGVLTYRVQERSGAGEAQADMALGLISVSFPAARVQFWLSSGEVGIYSQDGELRIAIEKDFRCLTRSPEEQEADAYPHPAKQCTA